MATSQGWRVWLAFESKPGVTMTQNLDLRAHWRSLAESCRSADGKVDAQLFDHWFTLIVEHSHFWGYA